MKLTVSSAIDDAHLLGVGSRGSSWATWRAVLRAMEGLPLTPEQAELFRTVAEREPPSKRVREFWAIVGRRGGKGSVASAIATAAALRDYSKHLRPGEKATVVCLAVDRAQARLVSRLIRGYFHNNPLLKALISKETEDELELNNGVEIVVATNSFRAIRGRTIACAILDECAYFRSDESANPDVEVYNAILPAMTTIPDAILVGISSPYRRSGLLFEKWREHYGQDDDDTLVVKGHTKIFNPSASQRIIDRAFADDPERASAEYAAEWRSDIADFIDRTVVDSVTAPGRYELLPISGVKYFAFVDPSGGSSDSMTLAIGHKDKNGNAILDAIRERKPPFSPESVVEEFCVLLGSYRITKITGDRYGGEWPRERFKVHGIQYETSDKTKSELYLELLSLVNGGRVELLDNKRLIAQLCSLERRTARSGKDSVDHPRDAHDDIINSVAGVLVFAVEKPAFVFSDALLARARIPARRRFNPYTKTYM